MGSYNLRVYVYIYIPVLASSISHSSSTFHLHHNSQTLKKTMAFPNALFPSIPLYTEVSDEEYKLFHSIDRSNSVIDFTSSHPYKSSKSRLGNDFEEEEEENGHGNTSSSNSSEKKGPIFK